jgi:hypothetical protein
LKVTDVFEKDAAIRDALFYAIVEAVAFMTPDQI